MLNVSSRGKLVWGEWTRACRRTGTRLTLRRPASRLTRRSRPPRPGAGAPARPPPAAPAPPSAVQRRGELPGRVGRGASTTDSARRGARPPRCPQLAARCRGARRAAESVSQAPCSGLVNASGRCCSDLTRSPLWTWGLAAYVSFPEGSSRPVDQADRCICCCCWPALF